MEILSAYDESAIAELRSGGHAFWLDLTQADPVFPAGLEETLGIDAGHEVAVHEGALPPALTAHDGHMSLVLIAVTETGDTIESEIPVVILLSDSFLVTVHDERVDFGLDSPRKPRTAATAFARAVAVVANSYPPAITALDDEIERAQELALDADRTVLGTVQALRGRVLRLRRNLVAQRDSIGRSLDELLEGEPTSSEIRAVRNGYERFVRLADMLESSRELIFAATDLYLSAASNRLGLLAERLTVFAAIFLPATVVVGFFGQNFAWLSDRVDTFEAFIGFGLVGLAATVAMAALILWRGGYLGD